MSLLRSRSVGLALMLGTGVVLCGCDPGNGPGTAASVPGPGGLARGPLPAMMPTPTSVGPANTGPAGSAASVGDGTAGL